MGVSERRPFELPEPERPGQQRQATQVEALAKQYGYQNLGPVHRHNPQAWEKVAGPDFGTWWFHTSSTSELTGMLFEGHSARARAHTPGTVSVLDRGRTMLLATATATCAVKDALPLGEAEQRVRALAPHEPVPEDEFAVLLLASRETDPSLALAQQRSGRTYDRIYLRYQQMLHRVLVHLAQQGAFDAVLAGHQWDVDQTHAHIRALAHERGNAADHRVQEHGQVQHAP